MALLPRACSAAVAAHPSLTSPSWCSRARLIPIPWPARKRPRTAPRRSYGEGGSKYRTAYYSFEESFTSNLADSPGLIQVDLAVFDPARRGRVLQWVHNHELAIRSAILAQLAATTGSRSL